MAVHIRLRRTGKKRQPYYRIVATDSRRARDGRFLEALGHYSPVDQPASVIVKEDRIMHWLDDGAEPSDTVRSLLSQIGFMEKYEKVKRNEDVSDMVLETTITERKKKTRKMKKAAVKAAEAAADTAAETETKEEAAAEETPADDTKEEGGEAKEASE